MSPRITSTRKQATPTRPTPSAAATKGMTQFLDEKSFKPGLGNYKRKG